MKKLKIILQSNLFYLLLFVLILIYVLVFTKLIKYTSCYKDETVFIGTVTKYVQKETSTTIYLSAEEDIIVNYYDNIDIQIGDKIEVTGTITDILPNTIPNTFNYKKYLYNSHIYTKVVADKIKIITHSSNVFVKIKNYILNKSKNNTYLLLFICGDKNGMAVEVYNSFKNCGIAHLLAISGMHVSIFILILNKLLFFINKNIRNILIILFLIFYSYLVNYTPSILRVVISFMIGVLLSRLDIHISSSKKLLLTAYIILLIDPFNIYSTSFQYSFSAAMGVISSEKFQKKNYLVNIIIISFWTLLFTLPITINLNYEINLMLFISNILFIPYVSSFLYPLGLLTFIFPFLNGIFTFFTNIMELIINLINKVDIFIINVPKMSFIFIVIFYLFLFLYLQFNKKRLLLLLVSVILTLKIFTKFDSNDYVIFFDVGQGDSAALISKYHNDVILIDTGGLRNYNVSDNIILYFKSIGITKLDTLILTHGDYDHMGESFNYINNFKIDEVIFNPGSYNDLELELIKLLEEKNIPYYQNIKELNQDENKLYFLNTRIYDNENDNSNVIYYELNNYKFLFMGDAGIEREEDILEKYNLEEIDFLKVGHHGSNTSSSKEFINRINPKYSLISVGKNNRYGHPKESVLDILSNYQIYRTDLDGSIEIKINENGYKVKIYAS